MQNVETGFLMKRLATDILGELPETEAGNRYILVVAAYYTKWTESFVLPIPGRANGSQNHRRGY